eukprot:2473822-Rhodomonas_salina.1
MEHTWFLLAETLRLRRSKQWAQPHSSISAGGKDAEGRLLRRRGTWRKAGQRQREGASEVERNSHTDARTNTVGVRTHDTQANLNVFH